ncbi:MAG: hypothetical protein JXA18_02990 [Chitinispirillaceae bacterium]|nr:hypothetical protein [Chitinispirillaceae bacterium]
MVYLPFDGVTVRSPTASTRKRGKGSGAVVELTGVTSPAAGSLPQQRQ